MRGRGRDWYTLREPATPSNGSRGRSMSCADVMMHVQMHVEVEPRIGVCVFHRQQIAVAVCSEVVSFSCTRLARPGTGLDLVTYFLPCAGLPDETLVSTVFRYSSRDPGTASPGLNYFVHLLFHRHVRARDDFSAAAGVRLLRACLQSELRAQA